MKKLILAFLLICGAAYIKPSEVQAQEVSSTEVDDKTQAKVEKSKEQLEKYQSKRQKEIEKHDKVRAKFDSDNAAGKLSPNDADKITKKLDKQTKSIEKLEKKIAKLEEFIEENS